METLSTAVLEKYEAKLFYALNSLDSGIIFKRYSFFKDNEIICWDMRNLGAVLHTFERFVDTNQRIYFEIDK